MRLMGRISIDRLCAKCYFQDTELTRRAAVSYPIAFNISLECVDKNELWERFERKADFVLVDTIGQYNGNRYRIKGATTIPYPEVAERRKELLKYKEIIVYCKEKSCVASKKVAAALKILNVPNVKVYEGGIVEWMENGLPVEESQSP
jgi:rhodanese-related sulfurtransferase